MAWALGLLAVFFIQDGFNYFSEEQHYSHITTCTERECQARRSPAINNLFSFLQETSSKKSKGLTHTHTHTHTHTLQPSFLLSLSHTHTPAMSHTHSSTFSFPPVSRLLPLSLLSLPFSSVKSLSTLQSSHTVCSTRLSLESLGGIVTLSLSSIWK